MFGKKPQLTPLEARRQILLLESELNRVQFVHEWNGLKGEIHRLAHPLQMAGAFISSATRAGAAFSILRRILSSQSNPRKGTWISNLLNGAKAGVSLWLILRSCLRKP